MIKSFVNNFVEYCCTNDDLGDFYHLKGKPGLMDSQGHLLPRYCMYVGCMLEHQTTELHKTRV